MHEPLKNRCLWDFFNSPPVPILFGPEFAVTEKGIACIRDANPAFCRRRARGDNFVEKIP